MFINFVLVACILVVIFFRWNFRFNFLICLYILQGLFDHKTNAQTALMRIMASSRPPSQEDEGRIFFCLSGGFTVENLGGEGYTGKMFFNLRGEGGHPRSSSLHPSQGKSACS